MAIFQNMAGKKLSDQLTLFVGNVMQIKIIPGKGELVPFRLTVAPANFMKLLEDHTRKTANFEIYKLKAAAQGSGQFWANNDKGVKAGPINVTVKQPLTLPTGNENQLALIKLLLAESPSPAYANYNIATFKTGMQWMRLVVENRLKMKSYLVGSEGATTLIDVIKARNQFEGFGSYPTIAKQQLENINNILAIASDGTHPDQQRFYDHVSAAIAVVTKEALIADPCPTKLLAWRTSGSGYPGGSFKYYKTFSGQDFYTIPKK